jgi:diguanylate cyclase (GGDEF)-like protein/PAS domain S-box-containing protein
MGTDEAAERQWRATAALDAAIDPVAVARPVLEGGEVVDLEVVYANAAARRWGLAIGAPLGPGLRVAESERFARYVDVYRTGRPLRLDAAPTRTAGTDQRYVDLHVSRMGDHLLMTWRDVTALLSAEREREHAESRFRAVLDNLIDPAVIAVPQTHPDGSVTDLRLTYVNRAARGWGAMTGDGLRARTARIDRPGLFDAYLRVLETGEPLLLDRYELTTPAGVDRVIDVRAVRVEGALVSTWRDVTDRHRHEQQLADSETRFRMAFDDAPVGMSLSLLGDETGPVDVLTQVNRALADLLGADPVDLVGRSCADRTHPDDHDDPERWDELRTGEAATYRREKRLLRSDGTYVWVRAASAATPGPGPGGRYAITHVEDITDRKAAEAELQHRALYDPLTGLANRVLLLDHLGLATREIVRDGGALAVLYLDLDRFKDVNDTLGHAAGDDVLRQVADRITAVVRSDATAARLAGDEFVVGTRATDDLSAVRIAERLIEAISRPIRLGLREIVVRPSIGIATTSREITAEALLRQADLAMYHAKHRGREQWALYDDALHALAVGRLAIEGDLRQALAAERLRLLYQPIVDLADGRVVSAEALLRLEHPERGLLAPAAFIDVAEDSDLIVPIGGWVLREAAGRLAEWQKDRPDMALAVNVSARQVQHLALHRQVEVATLGSGTSLSDLHLEITERVLLDAGTEVLTELRSVTKAGCGLAIDDFGTGYSSLAYLTRFPVTELKIDRTFVAGLGRRDEDTAVVEAIIGLARALGLGTVAEGVETPEQLGLLRDLGCAHAQGYHFGRPMSADDLARMVRAS